MFNHSGREKTYGGWLMSAQDLIDKKWMVLLIQKIL
jgi:hypothetical protein